MLWSSHASATPRPSAQFKSPLAPRAMVRQFHALAHRKVSPILSMQVGQWYLQPEIPRVFPALQALLRTKRPLTRQERDQLENKGVQFETHQGRLLESGGFYAIRAYSIQALLALEKHPQVTRVDASGGPASLLVPPLRKTAAEVQAYVMHQLRHNELPIRGKGIKLGSIDSGIDIFHPLFFRADGGFFAWIDVDKDGKYTPCTDAVDMNKNGTAEVDEKLCCIQGRLYDRRSPNPIDTLPSPQACRAGIDWPYQDKNNNGKRDYGPKEGFKESDPSYGEAMFVIDDANRNGKLDINERLVALKSSKIAATYINGVERTRGKDLILTKVETDITKGDASHGTGSSSVMLAGQPGYTQNLGIAPDADLLIANTSTVNAQGQRLATIEKSLLWLKRKRADVVLHEYAIWVQKFLDGSSAHEQMVTQFGKEGQIQICPTGNLGTSAKHARITVPADSTKTIDIQVPPTIRGRPNVVAYFSFLWRDDANSDLTLTLIMPNKTRVTLQKQNPMGRFVLPKAVGFSTRSTSLRQTTKHNFTIQGYDPQSRQYISLPSGTWTLEIKTPKDKGATFHAYVSDAYSGWGRGIAFTTHVDDDSQAGWPSTADDAIGVAAYAGRDDSFFGQGFPEKAGQLRYYSNGGPRIDGKAIYLIAAPDNPMVGTSPTTYQGQQLQGFAQYSIYGGTSGASPHVAAAAGLLKQLHPKWTQRQVAEAFRKGALVDKDVDVQIPHKRWGYGKLRIYRSLYGKDPAPNTYPRVTYDTDNEPKPVVVRPGHYRYFMGRLPSVLKVKVSDKEDKAEDLSIRWDKGYDGIWSTPSSQRTQPWILKNPGQIQYRAEVTDKAGATDTVLLTLEVVACQQDKDCGDGYRCTEQRCDIAPKPEPEPAEEAHTEVKPSDASTPERTSTNDTNAPPAQKDPEFNIGIGGGCGCQPHTQSTSLGWLLLLLTLLPLIRRRSHR